MLALLYYNNEFFEPDDKKALIWARRASAHGDIVGHFVLAELYRDGRGVDEDIALAIELFQKSADGGDRHAEIKLSDIYMSGKAGWMMIPLGVKMFVVYAFEEAILEGTTWKQYGKDLLVATVIEIRNFMAIFETDTLPDT